MAKVTSQPIYLITDGGKLRAEARLVAVVREVLDAADGSVGFVQLREQAVPSSAASDREVLALAQELLPICHSNGAKLIINRRADLAAYAGADGVHLGKNSISIQAAREVLGPEAEIGYSAHSVDETLGAYVAGASYTFLSPIFTPGSKTISHEPLGLEPLREAASSTDKLLFALGGIDASNAASCQHVGASGVAAISALLYADDLSSGVQNIVNALNSNCACQFAF